MDFLIGGVAAGVSVIGYLMLLALYDWFDMRQARRIQRAAAAKPPHP